MSEQTTIDTNTNETADVQAEQPKEPMITLTLSVGAVQAILAGLGKLPLENVKGLYDGIVQLTEKQLKEQNNS